MEAQIKVKSELKIVREEEIPHLLIPGELGAVLELTVRDKDGKVTEHRIMRSKSFVRQFLELLWVMMNASPTSAPLSIRDTGNTPRNIKVNYGNFRCDGAAGAVTTGIIVGTGVTAPTINDYKIETIIPHGVAAGQLQYSDTVIAAAASDATTSQVTITRNFANASGGAITVNEIALYVVGQDTVPSDRYFMTIRDAIPGGIAVPNGQTLTVNYREQAVV